MILLLILAILTAAVLYVLHYGYKLAFYNNEAHDDPYDFPKDDQNKAVEDRLCALLDEVTKIPFEEVSIMSHDGLKLYGRYSHVEDGAPLEIQFHGYKGNAIRDFCGAQKIAREAGRNILLIDERCHGKSEGNTITFGVMERLDCLNWIQFACERFGSVPIFLSGVSMGAATVLMASELELPNNVAGIIADCPYSAPAKIIRKVLGQDMGMPVKLVYPLILLGGKLYGKFHLESASPEEAVKKAKVPILLIHGDDDRFVPWDMSREIHAAAPEKIEFHTISGAGHALCYVVDPEKYHSIVHAFTKKCMETSKVR